VRDPVATGASTDGNAKFCMVNHLVFELGLSAPAIGLYAAFLKFADNETGESFPSRQTLAKILNVSVPTVDKYIEELREAGLVRSFPRWRDTEGKVSDVKSDRFNAQTSNGYIVLGYEGVSNIFTRRGQESLPGGVKNLYTNYTHVELDPDITRGGAPPKKSSRGTRISEGWMPDPKTVEKVKADLPGLDLASEHEKFVDYFLSVSGSKGVKVDWNATWRNWMRRAKQWSPAGQGSGESKADYFKNMAASKVQQLAASGQGELEGF
jgi:hypothetical protein